jgi:hypothetical protein
MTKRRTGRQPRGGKAEFALSVCSAVANGKPDMYNAVPKRPVTIEESRSHAWPHFFDGETKCPQGHVAARYVSNAYRCIDCARIADGKLPIYGKQDNMDLIAEAVLAPSYLEPALRTDFKWDDEKFRQFCAAYVNTGSVEAALKLVLALPYDLILELRGNPERAALFEAARNDADQVFLWKAEGSAATGSDRAMLARAGATFPDRFGSRSQVGLDTQPYINPDKALAELTQLLSSVSEQITQQDALGAPVASNKRLEKADSGPAGGADSAVEEVVLLEPAHDNRDLVSDT